MVWYLCCKSSSSPHGQQEAERTSATFKIVKHPLARTYFPTFPETSRIIPSTGKPSLQHRSLWGNLMYKILMLVHLGSECWQIWCLVEAVSWFTFSILSWLRKKAVEPCISSCAHGCLCSGQRLPSGVFLRHFYLHFFNTFLPEPEVCWFSWTSWPSQRSFFLCLPSAEMTGMCHCSSLFT